MEAGKHVICEKPMAATAADAKKMLDTSKRTGKLLTIGYQYRHFDANRAMKDYVSTGALGDIYYAETTAIRRRGIPTWGVFTNKAGAGRQGPSSTSPLILLTLTLWMMNNYEVESVTGVSFAKIGKYAAPDEMGNDFEHGPCKMRSRGLRFRICTHEKRRADQPPLFLGPEHDCARR